ncbi:DUF1048 domain-containing protein [Arthrobacter sp. 7Tela_A1]|uniref:DUF1048 domain-containing protein n=1 Tax=Arthrobacter sp. 7Tela_A1 TaxID=3093745 RepID=UPI003BB62CE2
MLEKITGSLRDKRRWREYKARKKTLPAPYGTSLGAVERYLTYLGALSNGSILMSMLEDLADLFERAAADRTPIRAVVGDDPVEFAETFLRNYSDGQWISKERERLIRAIDSAEEDEGGGGS